MQEQKYTFREATQADLHDIWEILSKAIQRRKQDGSTQWQDGYPNPQIIQTDIEHKYAFVLTDNHKIIGYCAIMQEEPEYDKLQGEWISNQEFIVYHRVAISEEYLGQGLAQKILHEIENIAQGRGIHSLRADTNFDNAGMLHLFKKLGYQYCGEVTFRDTPRMAFEKII